MRGAAAETMESPVSAPGAGGGGGADSSPKSAAAGAGDAEPAATAARPKPPLIDKRVRWYTELFKDGEASMERVQRRLTYDELSTDKVKGMGDADVPDDEPHAELARIEREAHMQSAQEDLLWLNDVVQKQVAESSERFDVASLEVTSETADAAVAASSMYSRCAQQSAAACPTCHACSSRSRRAAKVHAPCPQSLATRQQASPCSSRWPSGRPRLRRAVVAPQCLAGRESRQ